MSRQSEFPEPWKSLARRNHGAVNLAAKFGVAYSTLYRWAHGVIAPTGENLEKVNTCFDANSLPRPTYRTLRPE